MSCSAVTHITVPHRIALYLPSLRGGGAERVMVNLANGFVALGHQVDLVLVKAEGPYVKDVDARVQIVDLGSTRVLYSLFPLMRYLRENKPDGILSALNHANIIALFARLLTRSQAKLVVSEHGNMAKVSRKRAKFTGVFVPILMRWMYCYADAIVAVSRGSAETLAEFLTIPYSRIHVIYNPVVEPGLFLSADEPLVHPWGVEDDYQYILSVGRLATQKDFPTLLRAFAAVRKEHNVRLVILGEGELSAELEKIAHELKITKHMLMPGFVENPYSWMRHCAVFVLSSAWEGFGNVLVEAMACGAPVISTDCQSGPAEILEEGKWGRLVPVRDVAALADAIKDTLGEKDHPEVAIRAAEFDVDSAVDGYLRVMWGAGVLSGEKRD